MRKKFYLMVVAALTWTGCSQNEIMDTNPDAHRAIGFGVYTGTQTRGLVADNSETKGVTANGLKVANKGFGMQAYLTSGAYQTNGLKGHFMDNVQVTWETGAWTYYPVKFWPENTTDKISFFAYAPYTDAGNAAATGITLTHADNTKDPKLTFALQTAQQDMVDLVVSEPNESNGGTINQTKATASSSVNVNFKHVLTRVAMKAKTSADISATDNLTKVIITGVSIEHTEKLYSQAVLNMKTLQWETSGNYLASSYALEKYSDDAKKGIMNYTSVTHGSTTYNDAINISTSSSGVSLFPNDQYLFLIPVGNDTGTAAEGDVSVKITYKIITLASKTSGNVSTSENTKTVELPAGILKKGAAYEFLFTISLNAINLNVTDVEGWESPTPTEVTVQ